MVNGKRLFIFAFLITLGFTTPVFSQGDREYDLKFTSSGFKEHPTGRVVHAVFLGQQFRIYASFVNTGNDNLQEINYYMELDEEIVKSDRINLAAGQSINVQSLPFSFDDEGGHSARIVLDEDDVVSETNENNNEGQIFLTVRSTTDAYTVRISVFPESSPNTAQTEIQDSELCRVTGHIENTGSSALSNLSFSLMLNGNVINTGHLNIATGQTREHTFPNMRFNGLGEHTLFLAVDQANEIVETNEDNNETELTVVAHTQSDARAVRLSVFPESSPDIAQTEVREGELCTVKAYIQNLGSIAFSGFDLPFLIWFPDEQDALAVGHLEIAPGQTYKQIVPRVRFNGIGEHTLQLAVDPRARLIEFDEDNNQVETTINVLGQ